MFPVITLTPTTSPKVKWSELFDKPVISFRLMEAFAVTAAAEYIPYTNWLTALEVAFVTILCDTPPILLSLISMLLHKFLIA